MLAANPDYWDGAARAGAASCSGRWSTSRPASPSCCRAAWTSSSTCRPTTSSPGQERRGRLFYYEQPGPHVWWVTLNTEKPPFNNVLVRRAVNYAVNRDAHRERYAEGHRHAAVGPIPPAITWAYTDQVTQYPYDPGPGARSCLPQSGCPNAVQRHCSGSPESGSGMQSPKTMGTAIQADLAAVGVNASIQTFEWGAFLNKYGAGLGRRSGDGRAVVDVRFG